MRLIVCDRCGKTMSEEDVRHSITICRFSKHDEKKMIVLHCDRIKLASMGELSVDHEIDLCDTCKESFVEWFGKAGIYDLK